MIATSLLITAFGIFNLLGINQQYFRNQFIFAIIAVIASLLVRRIGVHYFRFNIHTIYWFFIGLLLITYGIGLEIKGSKRWIDFYFFSFQGSELFKIFFIMFLADFFVRYRKLFRDFTFFLKAFLYFILPALIIFKQPDLGNAIVFTSIFLAIVFFSSMPKKNIVKIVSLGFLILPIGWLFLKDYQKSRILAFLNPNTDQSGTAYNMIQAIITVGSGKFLGRGLGAGTQSGLSFLPENHTDFAFSSYVEQFGFLGGMVLIVLYLIIAIVLIRRIFHFYNQRDDDGKFKFLFLIGFFTFFITQVFINIGMNLGLLPITGITLPLLSYGGSSLLTWFIGIALLP